jgi:ribosome biogenesis GTPase / thiamine phosphate phosphatase
MSLRDLGWDERFAADFASLAAPADVEPGRVAVEFNYLYRVYVETGEIEAMLAGRVKHRATSRGDLPAVGDWVAVRRGAAPRGAIVHVLPRRTRFSRRMAGNTTDEQVVAANVNVIFITMALDGDFSLRRLERYLLMSRESGADPVVILTKPDLADDLSSRVADVKAVAADAPAYVVSPRLGEGLEPIRERLRPGATGALLGSSGVGKTTIINWLAGGAPRRTREVRAADSKGRHTTTHRELIALPGGGLVIDTPGMRELQLWDAADGVRQTFDDIEALAPACHFSDCHHRDEPRCAVKQAVAGGQLDATRLDSYLKLQDELSFLAQQQDQRAQIEDRRRAKVQTKALRAHLKTKR